MLVGLKVSNDNDFDVIKDERGPSEIEDNFREDFELICGVVYEIRMQSLEHIEAEISEQRADSLTKTF